MAVWKFYDLLLLLVLLLLTDAIARVPLTVVQMSRAGITSNWGIMIAWSAIHGCMEWPCLALYLSGVFWTVFYDTVYSHQDKEDDLLVGVKSTALKFGDRTKLWLMGFNSLTTAGLLSTGYLTDQTWPYYLGVAVFATHLGHQIYSVNLNDPDSCGQKFRSNRDLGLVFWLMILAANLLKDSSDGNNKSEELDSKTKQLAITLDSKGQQLAFENDGH